MTQALLFWEWVHPECEVGVEPCICVCLLICLLQTMERELGNNFKSKNGGKVELLLKKNAYSVLENTSVLHSPFSET